MSKVLIIVSSGAEAKEKAITGMTLARNSRKNNLFEDVRVIFMGPSENLLASADPDILSLYKDLVSTNVVATACVGVAKQKNIELELSKIGLELERVGPVISGLVDKGYVPMVF
ncbi:MAG: DsrE family protein [Candidatus Thermoplasmatota archaeon]|jgi:hypothetical protein|nr:DsrE family protein [Candidatus Thermoplasmatota archaeon]MCL5785960.1 DsrE family protein [Candidatus Thermoplasmatota archaeon]